MRLSHSQLQSRARRIRLLVFDVDGVLTDGTIWLVPALNSKGREVLLEAKGFSAHDGIGLALARHAGLLTGLITRRKSAAVQARAEALGLRFIRQGVINKRREMQSLLRQAGVDWEETACMGDDIIDLPMMHGCGFMAAPANARSDVRQAAHWIAPSAGGQGAARDLIEFILKARRQWQPAVRAFLAAEAEAGN